MKRIVVADAGPLIGLARVDRLELLEKLVADYVDILIANEDEARAFTGETEEHLAVRALAEKADIAVLKVGPRGSHIVHGGEAVHIPPMGDGTALDTTGAGDLWAAGFLFVWRRRT